MRIGIDITFLFDQYANRGIGNYSKEITKKLIADQTHTWVLFGFNTEKENYSQLNIKKPNNVKFVHLGKARKSTLLNPLYFKLSYLKKIKKAKLDLYFAPNFEKGLPTKRIPTVVMMHDIIPFVTNKYSEKGNFVNFIKGVFYKYNLTQAKQSHLVLTNSDFSKRELVHKKGFKEDRVVTTHLAVSDIFKKSNISKSTREIRRVLVMYKITKPYILYYGGMEFNKNITNLLHSFSKVSNRHPDLKLVLSGKEFKVGWDNKPHPQNTQAVKIFELIADLKLKHKVIITGESETRHLPIIMDNAEMFVHLSTYEGFGLAVLEGITAGTPVIAAKRSCYPEILQDGAMLINPYDTEKISTAILDVLQQGPAVTKQINRGLKVSTQYDWSNTATQTLKQFNNFAKETPTLKIAYLTPRFYPKEGNISNNCYNIAKKMVEAGHDITVFTPNTKDSKYPDTEVYEDIKIQRYRKINNRHYLGFYPKILSPFLFQRFDIVHSHGLGFVWIDLLLKLKKLFSPKTKFIVTPHNPFMVKKYYAFPKRILKSIYIIIQKLFISKIYTKIIQINPFQVKWFKDYKINPTKTTYIPNGLNDTLFNPATSTTTSEQIKIGRKFVISAISDFNEDAGMQYIVKALPDVLKSKKNVHLVLIGNSGDYVKKLSTLVEKLNLSKKITLLISPDTKTKQYILEKSDIFISANEREPFGINILEAMVKNNAIITTRTEGGEFLVKEEENGVFFDYADTKALSDLIVEYTKDRELLKTIQKNNIIKAKKFTWDKIAVTYSELLREITRK